MRSVLRGMRRAALFAAPLFLAACSGGSASGGHTPSPVAAVVSPSASPTNQPVQISTRYAIVVKDFLVEGGSTYSIALVDGDGKVKATVTAAKRSHSQALVQMPNLSASSSRVYYLDGDSSLKFLQPDGKTGSVKTLPVDASSAAVFAVSPDDTRIAVAIITYPYPAKTRIYVEDLNGTTNHVELFSSTSVLEWPVGWQGGHLVIGVGFNSAPQNYWEGFEYTAAGYHVADASTGVRIATVCANGVTAGPPVLAGTSCHTSSSYTLTGWSGKTIRSIPAGDSCGGGVVSSDGMVVADRCSDGLVRLVDEYGEIYATPYLATPVGWFDYTGTVIVTESGQLRIVDSVRNTAIDASGFFAGTLPETL